MLLHEWEADENAQLPTPTQSISVQVIVMLTRERVDHLELILHCCTEEVSSQMLFGIVTGGR